MIDFIEYVVAELKSKRLSKADAAGLVKQFSVRPSGAAGGPAIHPLLQRNTSDLGGQRYSSAFSGDEFFLADHQVAGNRVLPAVAYLEMVRAAIEDALPERVDGSLLELRNSVWAQPVVVAGPTEVRIALLAADGDAIDYEIYSGEGDGEVIHSQGRALFTQQPVTAKLDVDALEARMTRGSVETSGLYDAYAGVGLVYGPSFRALTSVRRGEGEVAARLRVPEGVAHKAADYVLHPSLLDGALQASLALVEDVSARVPFALETLRVISPCRSEMVAWVRYAHGSQAADNVVKLDVDLCDERGHVCVQIRGISSRALAPQKRIEQPRETVQVVETDPTGLAEKLQDYLRREFSELLKVPAQQIDARAALENYGIDSMLAMRLTSQLEKTFGSLPKTLFFEYQTLRDLAGYFLEQYAEQVRALLSPRDTQTVAVEKTAVTHEPAKLVSSRRFSRQRMTSARPKTEAEPVAIVGLSGRYPEAFDVEAYWRNLRDGKDCIVEVPQDRWNWKEWFTADRTKSGQHYSKWGGFIEGVDEFDPLFFNISPREAETLDPQERLFLQHAWMAIEDAGYTREGLQVAHANDLPGQVGVYAGVMYNEYPLFGAEAAARGQRVGVPGSTASIANRVSYALNLHGPSMTIDTMCSSSLTAIHIACQDLAQGRTSLAIAGGVNVTIHPNKYLVLSDGQFISSDGHCQSFGEGGDGYIPGEGVGVVVLKRLSDAERDGDHIYGVIRGTALTHGGKTNGYSVPNPQAQTSAISRALHEARVDARHVSYIEAHGTGTKLGDPIEIAALNKAFRQYTQDNQYCLIGSAKSNIGHCESAAGIAGLTKVLLQMQHRQIVPSLHSAQLNPHIDFPNSPFVVNQTLQPWEPPVVDGRVLPRIAGISSFGAGGSNAHVIIEEYVAPAAQPVAFDEVVVLLSARTPEQLQQKVRDLVGFIERQESLDLPSLAYTLQTGREAMDERLALVVRSTEELLAKLRAYAAGERAIESVHAGQVRRNNEAVSLFSGDNDLQQAIEKWLLARKFAKLLDLWVRGVDVDWSKLHGHSRPRRMSLPAYPFARERYWIDVTAMTPVVNEGSRVAVLHPLLHSNTSDLTEQRYSSRFSGEEFFLADHQVQAQRVLPGVAYLEMARAAIEQALPARPEASVLELRNTVWAQPIIANGSTEVHIALTANDEQIDFEVFSHGGEEDVVHCQGVASFGDAIALPPIDLERQLHDTLDAGAVYASCARMGLTYGPSFRAITSLQRSDDEVIAQLRLPADAVADGFVLHPSLMDGALQAAVGLMDGTASRPRLPFALDTLRVIAPCSAEMVAWVRYAAGSHAADDVVKLDVDLCDARGAVCVQMHGFAARALAMPAPRAEEGSVVAVPRWQASTLASSRNEFAEQHVIVCEAGDARQSIAERYSDCAVAAFEKIQAVLAGKPEGRVLVQIVIAGDGEQRLLAGLNGILRTATLENPQFHGQVILVPADMPADAVQSILRDERERGIDALVRYNDGVREVLRWQELAPETAPVAFRDGGVYVITGGFGGLGTLFANEILATTRDARVVLTGRSALTPEKAARLDARVTYRQLDLGDRNDVEHFVASIRDEYGRLDGVLHSAGMIADRFILRKSAAEFRDVLAPKVTGTFHLDEATKDVELDFLVLFSSIAGAMGNLGQADYAAANGFMDQFAAYRNALVADGRRHGRTRSINWPLWRDGGMGIDPAAQEMLRGLTGVRAMQTATGMAAFHRSVALSDAQLLVAEGDAAKIRRVLLAAPEAPQEASQPAAVVVTEPESLTERTQDYLREQLAGLLKMPAQKIDPQAPLENYGIDSVLVMKLTNQLEQTFGSLSKTLFFEYQTIAALAEYFIKAHGATLRDVAGVTEAAPQPVVAIPAAAEKRAPARRKKNRFGGAKAQSQQDIAIVGLAGRYPQARDLDEFWENLRSGRDCITEIPADRWNHDLYFDPDPNKPGKSYSKWGGFVADVDKFDPPFFNISPREAALIDPQERLFLETAWQTIEDAGYTKESISGSRTGVFVGVMWGQYELFGAEAVARGEALIPLSSHASIANRVSYFFDLHGPSLALDTMCSSSLTAIHLACEELRKGEIDAAIAGGVNLTVHPYKYLSLSQGKFAASDGRCRSFGANGDGYVPGEGVGAVLLKPLDKALRDGDQIYAVIRSTSVNHGGKTNGYSVPNPVAQGDLIRDALKKARIDPRTLSYVETHGTGTSLGDPIEITGLLRAFEGADTEKQSLPIGSVKSNIGHLESAAGIAAVTKALLQLRHKELVPSIHAEPLNPNIDFANSPFYVQTALAEWKRPSSHPRRVAVSSFGAGGSNAHLILEEYDDARATPAMPQSPEAFVLSARDESALRRYAQRIVDFIAASPQASLADIAYTSQTGRTTMDARLAVVVTTTNELRQKLEEWIAGNTESVIAGNARDPQAGAGNVIEGKAGQAFVDSLLASNDLQKIARLWTLGADIDWSRLARSGNPRRISLPTYPFAQQRCWIYGGQAPAPVQTGEGARPPMTGEGARLPRTEAKERTYYEPQWTPKPLDARQSTVGPILLLDESEELFQALQALGENVVHAKRHDVLPSLDVRPSVVLVHANDVVLDAVVAACKAFMPVRVMSVFDGNPLGAAMGGFCRTLTLEDPRCAAKAVAIPSDVAFEAKVALIRDELHESDWSAQEIRHEHGQRFARTLVSKTIVPQHALPIEENGVYVITGGFGGLGLIFAEHLARNYNARLVLTGRHVRMESLDRLGGADVLTVEADVSRYEDVERVVREARARFGAIHGVIHSAGVNRDALIVNKTREDIDAVLAPKVSGTIHLDRATRDENLAFFVVFSSVAGVLGNAGQCDYAFANRFLDAFAEQRKGPGRTLSINWPLWEEGGMSIPREQVALLEKRAGIVPLPSSDGIRYFEDFLRADAVQGVALYGIASRIAASLAAQPARKSVTPAPRTTEPSVLTAKTEAWLKEVIGAEIQLEPERIGSADRLESFGLDSVMIGRINGRLENDLPGVSLPKTLLYEHETIHEVARFLLHEAREALVARFALVAPLTVEPLMVEPLTIVEAEETPVRVEVARDEVHDELEPIAIIGMHGYYPHSATLDEYWEHLKNGRDLTEVVPAARWNAEELFDADPTAALDGKIYCKWGAFLDDYDKFDPRFFNIPSEEAKIIDPQERLFLQSVWAALEDAGYTRERLKKSAPKGKSADAGVFVGVTTNSYMLVAADEGGIVRPGAMPWSIANRVSYFFDFNGPSMPIDTACSSSLVALHLACESLRRRECQVAIAGGVNLYLHPAKYNALCQKRSLAADGKTSSYGAGDDGFIPGEGVGTAVLKPLRKAIADGDRIHAVIRASAYDHSGRSNGYSAPNPSSQASLIAHTLEKAGIHPESISYVEGHGTGTQLGDSLEISALTQAFRAQTEKQQFCSVGSVKANIGHSESAAGIAGLAKVVLQLEHRMLAPTIHAEPVNPNLELDESPFYLQRGLSEWRVAPAQPRRALINSFGAGGVNACVVIEEYEAPREETRHGGAAVFTLSAKNEERLRDYATHIVAYLRESRHVELASLCYTLQTGREAMEERLSFVAASIDDVIERLTAWTSHGSAANIHRGSLGPRRAASVRRAHVAGDHGLEELAAMWAAGEKVDWDALQDGHAPRRIALPTYPFARERYWVSGATTTRPTPATHPQLHPLIAYNASTLRETAFASTLSDKAFYALDHVVNDESIFPGAGFLEMACIAGTIAGEQKVRRIRDIVWIQPLSFRAGAQEVRTTLRSIDGGAEYVISSFDDDNEAVVHTEGRVAFANARVDLAEAEERISIQSLKALCVSRSGAAHYAKFREHGFQYGPSFRTVQELHLNETFALARLSMEEIAGRDFGQYILHPSIIDGALQTVAGLAGDVASPTPYVPFALDEIEIVRAVPQSCWAYVERAEPLGRNRAGVAKFNIRLLNESGDVLIRFTNLYVRPLAKPLADDRSSYGEAATQPRRLHLSGEVE